MGVRWEEKGKKASVLASWKESLETQSENIWASPSSSQAKVTLKSLVAEARLWF